VAIHLVRFKTGFYFACNHKQRGGSPIARGDRSTMRQTHTITWTVSVGFGTKRPERVDTRNTGSRLPGRLSERLPNVNIGPYHVHRRLQVANQKQKNLPFIEEQVPCCYRIGVGGSGAMS